MIKVKIPKTLSKRGQKYYENIVNAMIDGVKPYSEDYTIIESSELTSYTLTDIFNLVDDEGDIENLPSYLIMPTTKLTEEIPEGLPNRIYSVEEVDTIHTWETWRDNTHLIRYSLDETLATFGLNSFGEDLKASEIKIIDDLNDNDITILLTDAFIEEMNTAAWKEEE